MTSTRLRHALIIALFVAGFFLPHNVFAQVWEKQCLVGGGQCHDISDFWIPVTNRNAAYGAMGDCAYSGTVAAGASCAGYTGPSPCKVNTVVNNEYIYTDVYTCPTSSSSCTLVQTSPGTHTLTGYQWVNQANTAYAGTQLHNWPSSANACLGSCEAYPNSKYCFVQTYWSNYLSNVSYTCTAFSDWSSGNTFPPQTTFRNGEPDTRTVDDSYKYEPVYAYTDPTYGCQTPTATLSANPVSITRGSSSTLTSSCSNASSASINQGVGTVPTSNSTHSVSPTATTQYTLTCTDSSGQKATDSVTISVTDPPISGSCSVSPTSITAPGSTTWSASASGGNGTYSYSWTDSNNQFFGTGPTATHSYSSAGTYGASVTITSGTAASKTINCSNSVTVNSALPDLVGAGVTPTSATAGTGVTLVSNVKNQGNASAQNFYTLFQKATDSSGSNAADLGTFYESTVIPGGGNSYNATYTYTFPSSGTYYVRACADKSSAGNSGVINESNENNNCGPWTAVTVSAGPQPDLTAGSITPTSATAGTGVALVSNVKNQGNAATGAGFYTLFQKATDSSGSNAADLGTFYSSGSLPGGGNTINASYSYTFSSSGTYYARACADKSSAGNAGVIAESDENNNCGPWTSIAVGAPAPTGSLSCTVNNQNPVPGSTVTYTVTPSNGATGPYTWNDTQGGSYGTGASASRTIPTTGSYVMTVSGQNVVNQPVSCPVVTGGCGTASGSISANPTRVRSGQTSTLTWNASGVNTSCVISGPGVNKTDTASSCTVGNPSLQTPAITAQSIYTLTCDGVKQGQVIVNVIPSFQEF